MTFYPRSLLARTVVLIAILLIISQTAWINFFRLYAFEPRAQQAALQLATTIRALTTALETIPEESRDEFFSKFSSPQGLYLLRANEIDIRFEDPRAPFVRSLVSNLKEQLGDDLQVFVRPDDKTRALWIKVHANHEEYWLVMPRNRIERAFPWVWIGWSAFGILLAVIGAYLLVRRINRPLRALTIAAKQLGEGKTPSPIPEDGPTEIETLSRGFNQMTKDLQRLDADRALLLAGVSHDLRTPLSRLRLGVEMLDGKADATLMQGMIEDIEDMDAIINQFLSFIREGSSEETQTEGDLNAIVFAVCERFAREGKTIATKLAPLPPVPLKPMAIQRLITNLVDNAFRYGEGEVEIQTQKQNRHIVLKVLDRGPGIPEQEKERMLQPFTRIDSARGSGGSGLGLAIVERIAKIHDGAIHLLSREGGGLEAKVELPLP